MTRFLRIALLWIVIVLVVFSIIGLSNSNKPPSPTITVGNKKIPTLLGTYCWSGIMNAQCVDTIPPPGIVANNNLRAIVVSPEAKLKIDYKNKPKKDSLSANIWFSDEESENVNLAGNTLIAPGERGVYVYSVHANWEKGSSSHVFVIEVR